MIRARIDRLVTGTRARFARRADSAALHPAWQQCRDWWAQRSPREQVLLGILAITAMLALVVQAVIVPLRTVRQQAYADLHTAALLEVRLRAGDAGQSVSATGAIMRRGTAVAILSDCAVAARLTIERIEPEGANTRVVVGDAPFDQVIGWIADVERSSHLRVEQAQIERKGGPGIVRATFVVAG